MNNRTKKRTSNDNTTPSERDKWIDGWKSSKQDAFEHPDPILSPLVTKRDKEHAYAFLPPLPCTEPFRL